LWQASFNSVKTLLTGITQTGHPIIKAGILLSNGLVFISKIQNSDNFRLIERIFLSFKLKKTVVFE